MGIVLNEYDWAERAIESRELGKKPVETLSRVSKYYLANKYTKREIRRLLDDFMLQCDPHVSLVRWSDTLDRLVRNADKYPLIQLDGIAVTRPEMDRIDALKKRQLCRLAFTLLCVSKYWDMVSPNNRHWVNTEDSEIMKMANINTSIQRQSLLFSELRDAGLVEFSKKVDNINVRVVFMEDGEVVMHVRDFRNLGYQYLKYHGGPYIECANCGLIVKSQSMDKGRRQKYCSSCAAEIHTKQKVDSVMRHRFPENHPPLSIC